MGVDGIGRYMYILFLTSIFWIEFYFFVSHSVMKDRVHVLISYT